MENPVDRVWTDRPPPPRAPIVPHDLRYAGRASVDKRQEAARALEKHRAAAAVLTAPDSIAWLLNVRGGDVEHTPLPLSFAILHRDGGVEWFVDPAKVGPEVRADVGEGVRMARAEAFGPALDALGTARRTVQADPSTTAAWIFHRLERAGARVVRGADPCALPRAVKNEIELAGARAVHERGFKVALTEATFPMELFLLFGENYVGQKELGRSCHERRVAFEMNLRRNGFERVLRGFYQALAQQNLGRQIVAYAAAS